MSAANCHEVTIAHNAFARVRRCTECDCVSIELGPVTVRLDATALEALWSILGEALTALKTRRAARPGPFRWLA